LEIQENFMREKTPQFGDIAENVKNDIEELGARTDRENREFLEQSGLKTSIIFTHGYFPKDIVRFLSARLRESKIPCEVGFDKDLALSDTSEARQLKVTFNDPRPFYFLAFPLEHISKAREVMEDSNYPLPEATEPEMAAENFVKRQKQFEDAKKFKRLLIYLLFFLAGSSLIYLFSIIARDLL
jgi:hypothetical protein